MDLQITQSARRLKPQSIEHRLKPQPEIPLATPLAAYIRVPLSWYHSTTYAFFPDETHTMIRRVYTHPSQEHSKRHFCGYCGTPLSYWSEEPRSEAEYINLTLGSLLREDLRDLEDMGLIPEVESGAESHEEDQRQPEGQQSPAGRPSRTMALRESYGVPWFDGLVEGTRLGNMRKSRGVQRSQDGQVKVEWEIVEYNGTGDDHNDAAAEDEEMDMGTATPSKRKRDSTDAASGPTKDM